MILIVAPFTIPPTHLSFQLTRRFVKWLLNNGFKFETLDGVMANKPPFLNILKTKPEIDLVIYTGHGTPSCLCGESLMCNMFCTVDVTRYKKLIEDKVVISAPACYTARSLGKAMIENGARCYMGSVEAMYAQFSDEDHDYFNDWVNMFLTLYKHTVLENAGRGYEMYIKKGQQYIELYRAHLYDWNNSDWNIQAVKRNMKYFTLLGDRGATVMKEKYEPRDIWDQLRYALLGLFSGFSLTLVAALAPVAVEYGIKAYKAYKERKKE